MKKTLLFFCVFFFCSSASFSQSAYKTTTSSGRWYQYYIDLLQPYENFIGKDINYYAPEMWFDTSAVFGDTGSISGPVYVHNSLLSIGMGLDPAYWPWNNVFDPRFPDFTGAMTLTPSDAYTVDSVFVGGWYSRATGSAAKDAVVDTLILSFVSAPAAAASTSDLPAASTATGASSYGVSTLAYNDLFRDTVNDRAAHNGGVPLSYAASTGPVYKIPLTAADSCPVTYAPVAVSYPRVGRTDPVINFSVPANNIMAMTVTWKSGDTAYHAFPFSDTIRYANGTSITANKYNYWRPQIFYAVPATGSAAPDWPFYDGPNSGTGYFAYEGGGRPYGYNKYYPNWLISSGGPPAAPSRDQYPAIAFHIVRSAYELVSGPGSVSQANAGSIAISPNPANNSLVISMAKTVTSGSVTLLNILGQEVASTAIINSKAIFNTSALPAGVYTYVITANGDRKTGKIAVVH